MLSIVLKNTFFFKLMNNNVYGKAVENLRKRINAKDYKKHVTKPSFVSQNIFI